MTTTAADSNEPSDPNSVESLMVIRRIGQATKEVLDRSWQEVIERFDALEPELVDLCGKDADKREVRRRICESILAQVSIAEPPPDRTTYEALWQRMLQLGFTSPDRHLSMLFLRLTYLIERTKDCAAIEADLATFQEEVQQLLQKPDPELGRNFSHVHGRLTEKYRRA